jgi:hypothetical protein
LTRQQQLSGLVRRLRLVGAISGPICGVYCLVTFGAMAVIVLYRRGDYGVTATTAVPAH